MTGLEIAEGVVAIGGTLLGTYMGLKLKPLEDGIRVNEKGIETVCKDAEKALDTAKKEFDERLKGLHDEAKEAKKDLEARLGEVERSYVARAELTAAINDLAVRFEKGVVRIEQGQKELGAKVEHLAERVGKVEVQ